MLSVAVAAVTPLSLDILSRLKGIETPLFAPMPFRLASIFGYTFPFEGN